MRFLKLTKLAEAPDPKHPQNIPVGNTYYGTNNEDPKEGEMFYLYGISYQQGQRGLRTSVVQEIVSENTFRTYNSIYQWEVVAENDIPNFSKQTADVEV